MFDSFLTKLCYGHWAILQMKELCRDDRDYEIDSFFPSFYSCMLLWLENC